MNKKTVALTPEQYTEIINTVKSGFIGLRPNPRVAMALVLEANLGIRVSDITDLTSKDIVKDGNRYRLNIVEQKTGKTRTFTVPSEIRNYIEKYRKESGIKADEKLIDLTEKQVQRVLQKTCDYLGYEGIGTHSFRKFFATQIYENNGCDIALVSKLLQHSSSAITQRYIGISEQKVEEALANHINLI